MVSHCQAKASCFWLTQWKVKNQESQNTCRIGARAMFIAQLHFNCVFIIFFSFDVTSLLEPWLQTNKFRFCEYKLWILALVFNRWSSLRSSTGSSRPHSAHFGPRAHDAPHPPPSDSPLHSQVILQHIYQLAGLQQGAILLIVKCPRGTSC